MQIARMEPLAPAITTNEDPPTPVLTKTVRLPFIDNLRWVMIVLVVGMHAAVTYSSVNYWYYSESTRSGPATQGVLFAFEFFTKTFRMGLLFLLAGYFVPGAYDRKGAGRFLSDRAWRLGLPTLLFMIVLSPITGWMGGWHHSSGTPLTSFLHAYGTYITSGQILIGYGPLWFCVVLLCFSFLYAAGRETGWFRLAQTPSPFPGTGVLLVFILLLTVCTFLARIRFPLGVAIFNLQLGYFPQYIGFFIAGTFAWRHRWLTTLPAATGRRWGLITLAVAPLGWIGLIIAGNAGRSFTPFIGGLHWQSFGLSFIEALGGVGWSLGLITLFRGRFNKQGPIAAFLSANYFAVYVFHAPILVAITRGMSGWQGPILLKFIVAVLVAVTITYALSATVFRRIPLLKKIL